MYTTFFSLNENPFSIAPNPRYLYMSDRHREALAHLTFGLGDVGGFVLLTGEVGTGKTTVSKCLLEQLPENTDTAFILNPTLTELELLASICDELHLEYPHQPTIKQLSDAIHRQLLANHQSGRNTVLIIDEAQHLRPEVLEQLRLLTNLETHTKKLLQVILIGQPELQELLRRRELRQLAQRITARYHLLPLTDKEVAKYVTHRLNVAGCQRPLFTRQAIRQLHKASDGIPRVINLLCDRALLGAYGKGRSKVDHRLIKKAADEVLGLGEPKHRESRKIWGYAAMGSVTLALVVAAAVALKQFNFSELTTAQIHKATVEPGLSLAANQIQQAAIAAKRGLRSEEQSDVEVKVPQQVLLDQLFEKGRRIETAFGPLFQEWRRGYDGITEPCRYAQRSALECYWQQGDLQALNALDRPAVVRMQDQFGDSYYATLLDQRDRRLRLAVSDHELEVSQQWFEKHWQGAYVVLWSPPKGYVGPIGWSAEGESVRWLEQSLSVLLGHESRNIHRFDLKLQRKIEQFQRQQDLEVDGIAGVRTLIRLNNILALPVPRLASTASAKENR